MNSKIEIPKITKEEFWKRLKKRKYEEIEVINNTESFFLKKRGYVFKMPKKGENVILLVSGGLDSIVQWALLLDVYKLEVHPIIFPENNKNPESRALNYFSTIFREKYQNYSEPFSMDFNLIPKEYHKMFKVAKMQPETILRFYNIHSKYIDYSHLAGLSAFTTLAAYIYREYLSLANNIRVNTIFIGLNGSDGEVIRSQTFTFLRETMLFLSLFNHDFHFQISSMFLEKELGFFLKKSQVIKLGASLGLPLERTYSCYLGKRIHCGTCLSCGSRKEHFKKAYVSDKTIYQENLWHNRLKSRINYHLTNKTPLIILIYRALRKIIIYFIDLCQKEKKLIKKQLIKNLLI